MLLYVVVGQTTTYRMARFGKLNFAKASQRLIIAHFGGFVYPGRIGVEEEGRRLPRRV